MKMEDCKYPEKYEIEEVCRNFLKRRFLNMFMQERGIFAVNATAAEMSDILANCVLDAVAIEELRLNAFQGSTRNSLSGFTLTSSLSDFSPKDLYEHARDNDKILLSKGYSLSVLKKESRGTTSVYKGKIDYEIHRPGRIQFMDKEKGQCEFSIFEIGNNEWQVEVDGTRAQDGKEVQKLFSKLIDKEKTAIHVLNFDHLTDSQTIEFFDEVIKRGLSKEWNFQDVVGLTFRRGRDEDDEEVEKDEDNSSSSSTLTGIRQAVLEGGHLREDTFVKQFEEQGCIFSAMTLEFSNKKTPEVIHIRAEFKGSPKIFEVSVLNSYEYEGTEGKKVVAPLSVKRNLEIRSEFWNNSRKIYRELMAKGK